MRPQHPVTQLKVCRLIARSELKQMCLQLGARVLDPPELMYEQPMKPPPL